MPDKSRIIIIFLLSEMLQDHIVSAVLLTKTNTFLTREEFNHLLYSSGVSNSKGGLHSSSGRPGKKVLTSTSEIEFLLPQPAILKPEPLWTGKQVSI